MFDFFDLKNDLNHFGILLDKTWEDGKYVAGVNVEIQSAFYSIANIDVSNLNGKIYIRTYGEAQVGYVMLDDSGTVLRCSLYTGSISIDNTYEADIEIVAPQ